MAAATASKSVSTQIPNNPYAPANWETYEAEKAERAAAKAAKRPLQLKCLDAETAAQHEARKPLYEFEVSCTYQAPDDKRPGKLKSHTETEKVNAQNDQDAWALFCDRIGRSPSPQSCDRTIKRLAKIN